MNSKEIIKLLKEDGFWEVRQRGSHKLFSNGQLSKKELGKGIANKILKDADLK